MVLKVMDLDELFERRLKDLKDEDPDRRMAAAWDLGKPR